MSIWTTVAGFFTSGAVGGVTDAAERVTGIWRENTEKSAQRHHNANLAVLGQFASEFRNLTNRTWWDSLIDGMNRLPRPLITLGVLSLFVLAPIDPERFLQVAQAYSIIPGGFWALLSFIVAFYFGGRMQAASADFKVTAGQVVAAKKIMEMRRAEDEEFDDDDGDETVRWGANKVVEKWKGQVRK